MKFAIHRAKFLEALQNISKILVDACKNEKMHYIVDDSGISVKDTAAFKMGLLEEANLGLTCPICGDAVSGIMNPAEKMAVYLCTRCQKQIPSALYESTPYIVSESNVANLVAKSFGSKYCQTCDDGNYRLGKHFGKRVYFCVSPQEGLYNSHNENIILVVCDSSSVPKGWANNNCKVIPFTEFFYMKHGEIRIADVVDELKPKEIEPRFGKHERVADRRDEWLEVLAHMFDSPYNPRDFRQGKIIKAAAARWFVKVHPKVAVSDKTLTREVDALCTYDKKEDAYDKHEKVMVKLFNYVADPKLTDAQRKRTSQFIMDLLIEAKEAAKDNEGVPVKLPDVDVGWIVGEDGHSERVLVTSNESIYRDVDRNLRREEGNG